MQTGLDRGIILLGTLLFRNLYDHYTQGSPITQGSLVGLPPKQRSKPPKLKYETLNHWRFFPILECQPPGTNANPLLNLNASGPQPGFNVWGVKYILWGKRFLVSIYV